MAHPLLIIAKLAIPALIERSNSSKKKELKEAFKTATQSVKDGKATTAAAIAPAAAATQDFAVYLPENLQPYAWIVNALFIIASGVLATWPKKNADK